MFRRSLPLLSKISMMKIPIRAHGFTTSTYTPMFQYRLDRPIHTMSGVIRQVIHMLDMCMTWQLAWEPPPSGFCTEVKPTAKLCGTYLKVHTAINRMLCIIVNQRLAFLLPNGSPYPDLPANLGINPQARIWGIQGVRGYQGLLMLDYIYQEPGGNVIGNLLEISVNVAVSPLLYHSRS